jgi:hypothetical protein
VPPVSSVGLITQDERYLSTIVPTRDGVMVALRVA